jgi:hypothetical protein
MCEPNRDAAPMRPHFVLICLWMLLLPCLATANSSAEWSLRKQAKGIDVYTRPVPGSDVQEFRGEAIVDARIDAVLALLRDASRFKEWFPNTSESQLLSREGPVSYQYSVMNTPWPVSDRDNVFRTVLMRDETSGRIDISVEAAPDAHPEKPDRHRVQRARGSWRLEPDGPTRTRVTFTMHLEPGGGIPDWMVNTRVVATPFEALTNLREIVGASERP